MNDGPEHARPVINKSRRLTPIWLLPLIALLIVCWLGWRTVAEAGLEVHVQFESGRGIKAGKTEVVHNGLVVGMVSGLSPTRNMNAVDVTIDINPDYKKYLREGSTFWLVKPQVSMAGISGLETLVSGNYIAFKPSQEGKKASHFKALEQAPPLAEANEGLRLTLKAKELSSLQVGSPVLYRRFKVGEVTGYSLAASGDYVEIQLYVNKQFSGLIKHNTRFWNAGGIDISGHLPSLKIRTQSLLSMIQGGIAFYTPNEGSNEESAQAVADGDQFVLYRDYEQAETGIPITIEFPLNVSLREGSTPILFHGFEVGRVHELDISDDLSKVIAEAVVRPEMMPGLVEGAQFWVVEPRFGPEGISGLDTLLGGRYIAVDVSQQDIEKQRAARHFNGHARRPPAPASAPGLHLTLSADALSGISAGSPVLFRNIPVGSVQDYQLKDAGVDIRLLIEPGFSHLVNSSSRFWNVSGVSVEAGLDGVKVRSATLNTLISGGIAFSTPAKKANKVVNGKHFKLYQDEDSAIENGLFIAIRFETAEGLSVGSLVRFRGMRVGRVTDLAVSPERDGVHARVFLDKKYQWLASEGSLFWLVKPKLGLAPPTWKR
ncbi:MlaD family protein [Endozoicomonas sp. Mp262]|uniref:PqiB family protein n=1 Tax=Endozoicomonas sp. Mp262 TaxID=2919499 RepID=UPI0021D8EC08